jgi:subtilisin-like proprotein convertase family protein
MSRRIEALTKLLVVAVVAGILPLAMAGTASAARVKTIRITNASVVEGTGASVNMNFTVSWTGAKGGAAVTVGYATTNASATAPADYTTTTGTATMSQSGCHCATITVPVVGDVITEGTETFRVNLSNPVGGVLGNTQGIGTIYDNEGPPALVVADASALEATGQVSFSVLLTNPSASTVTVDYATADATATSGSDYTAKSSPPSLSFSPMQTSKTVTVTVADDVLSEDDETFTMNLSNAAGAAVADARGVGTILDDDPEPDISIGNATVTEGDSGTVTASFSVTLSAVSGREVDVDYATADGTATAGSDYQTKTGTLVFPAGQTTKQVDVTVDADLLAEANETFTVALSGPQNANILAGGGLGTITDDDSGPRLSVNDPVALEGAGGTTPLVFTVSMLPAAASVVTVSYATADGTATAGSDYTAVSGTLTFSPGNLAKTVTVNVAGDTTYEPDQTLTLTLSNPSGAFAKISDAQGTGTITNDDAAPAISIGNVTVTEGDAGTVTASFPVTLSIVSGFQADVDYATVAGTATAGSDYQSSSGTLAFAPGQTTKQVDVTVNADVVAEGDETFTVGLSAPLNATILGATGVGTITDDDAGPKLSIGNATVVEGNSGPAALTFTVSMDPISASVVTVDYATAGGTATAGSDYTTTSGTLTFAAGEVTKTVTLDVTGDTTYEPDETLTLNLSNPVGGLSKIIDAQGIGTITNDDKAPTALTMKLAKGKTTIQAKGVIELAVSGLKVKATLYKKKGAKYVRVTSRSVSVTGLGDRDADGRADGAYLAKFTRPARGAYQLKVAYAGSTDLLPCLRSVKFKL